MTYTYEFRDKEGNFTPVWRNFCASATCLAGPGPLGAILAAIDEILLEEFSARRLGDNYPDPGIAIFENEESITAFILSYS